MLKHTAYVPYHFWREAEPRIASIIQTSLSSYRHEILLENFAGIPVLQQHGTDDDNVPAHHSRRLNQISFENGQPTTYVELLGKGHWYDGVMTTEPLRHFYESIHQGSQRPGLPNSFTLVLPSSGDMRSRGGVCVDQLISPDQLGKISVVRDDAIWMLKTSNIHRLHFDFGRQHREKPNTLVIDGFSFSTSSCIVEAGTYWLIRSDNGSWAVGYLSPVVWLS